jgi:hypothetical protein
MANTDKYLWGDRHYQGMRAPDGTDISSRTKHREYMKRHGLTTSDDFKTSWQKAEQQRVNIQQGHDRDRRSQVERAIYDVMNNKRKIP